MAIKYNSYKENYVPGSKIPLAFLIDYIKDGYTISDFLSSYPWIKRTNVQKALDELKRKAPASRYAV